MKLYTKTGDAGTTGLFGGARIPKDSLHVETYGTVDELNSVLGWAACACSEPELSAILTKLQVFMFELGADLSTPLEMDAGRQPIRVSEEHAAYMEEQIDWIWPRLAPMRYFILPGGTELAARLHMARTVARRAERLAVTLSGEVRINAAVIPVLNRLSDLLFAMARFANQAAGVSDVHWQGKQAAEG